YRGARQVAFAIIATTLTLVAVFVPLSFMGGNVGRLFTEFGFTLAFAVIVSSFVALTLAPMLCSRWLHHSPTSAEGHRLWAATERLFDGLNRGYAWLLKKSLGAPAVVLALGVAGLFLAAVIFPRIGQELAPVEDRGVFIIPSSAPQGATAAYTEHHVRKVEQAVAPLVESGDVTRVLSIVGFGGQPERAFTIIGLAPWEARSQRQQDLAQSVAPKLGGVPGLRAFPVNPPGLGQSAFREPVQFIIGGSDYVDVQQWADALLVRARELPSLQNVDLDFEETRPQLAMDVLRDRAADLGISVEDVALTLQTLLASRQVTRYLDRGREYEVMLQAEREDRASPDALAGIFLRSTTSGELIPLSALVELREFGAAPELKRIDRLPAITLTASLAPGYDLGSALRELQGIAAEVLPDEARISYGGLSREFADTSSAIYVTFALAFLVVFLVLAAQFESWIHPLIIMLSVPLAVTGALLALWMAGISLNIYSQIGMVMLLGLMAKNGILIVEFANQLRDAGRSVRDAIIEGAILRFRPVLMTTISTVFGAIPLVLASGAGAESRMSIGVVILGGLLFATTLTLFIIPVLYDLLARFARSANAIHHELEQQAQAVPDRLGE
ncbi:MAG: efflux RND transporter permease subunit, partial [Gammaproteobacteria bacterium]|nr:efflux RND transporter permease subunit [Gammaproteobacteria bacterium]